VGLSQIKPSSRAIADTSYGAGMLPGGRNQTRRRKMLVRDVMTPDVCTATPDTTIGEIAQRLAGLRISAVPVVDLQSRVVGIISESDLLRRMEIGTEIQHHLWAALTTSSDQLAKEFVRARARRAADMMTRPVITVEEDAPLQDLAELLERKGIKRAPVVRDGKLVGIVSRADLVRALARKLLHDPADAIGVGDRTIAECLRDTLRSEPWADAGYLNFIVENGVVELWGIVTSPERRQAIRVAAENAPGVRRVIDKLTVRALHVV
jgi:CBS domain-containing protein